MTATVRAALASVAFLTRVPVGRLVVLDAGDVARGAALFPLVGGLVGAAAGLLADVLVPRLPALVAGALAVGLAALVTGALHLDALADTADALGGATRERALEIMRDHAIGSYGAVALAVVCLVDASVLAALAAEDDALLAAAIAGAVGRAAILPHARVLPSARSGGGQGSVLEALGWPTVIVAVAIATSLALAGGVAGLVALAAGAAAGSVMMAFVRSWLGGVTGDTLGATAKLCETAALVGFLAAR